MRKAILAAVVLSASAGTTLAEGTFTILGAGAERCDVIVAHFEGSPTGAAEIFAWTMGYMTGVGAAYLAETGRAKDLSRLILEGEPSHNNGLVNPIIRLCREHPQIRLATAAGRIYDQLPE